jgi:flagellar hook-associated protein 2
MSTTSSITNSSLSSLLASGQLADIGSTTNSSNTSDASSLIAPGLASGMDWESIIEDLATAERAPETQWEDQRTTLSSQMSALSTIKTDLATLQTDVQALQDSTLYQGTTAQSSDSSVATASSTTGATTGSFLFDIQQLATAAQLNGTGSVSKGLVPDGNPADVTIGTAGFSTPVTAGTFTVNGAQVTIATTDTLQDVFNKIASATDNAVTASYDSSTDEIKLTSNNNDPLYLGSSADTSNFLQVAQLYDTNADSSTSSSALGLASTTDPTSVALSSAGFSTPVTAGTFTVDGEQVTVATTDTLQDVFNNIASATNNAVTGSYDSTTDEITLTDSSGDPLVLGSAADTSNFLDAAKLSNTNAADVSSTSALGRVNTTVTMTGADLATSVDDVSNGAFTINGVSISYDASMDSIQNVLDKINSSAAGVTASYDSVNNRFVLANNSTGNVGISVKDVTGNFLAATGLSSGSLTNGQNLTYTLNNGTQMLQSESNTITSTSSGIQGLSVSALGTGTTTVTVSNDTSAISSAIQQFVTDYNSLQNYISSQQIVTTASNGTVTPGSLTGDETVNDLVASLRSLSYTAGSGSSSSSITTLGDLGIQSDGQNNTLTLSDTSTLDSALANNLSAVQSFFTNATTGVATQLNNYITDETGSNGELTNAQATLSAESSNIGTQITNLETKISSDTTQWTSEFDAMESAESQANQELTYLSEQVSSGSL